jgi:hypothetical protein
MKMKELIMKRAAAKLKQKLKGGFKEPPEPEPKQEHAPPVRKEPEPQPKHVCEKPPPPPPRREVVSSSVQTAKPETVSRYVQTDDEPVKVEDAIEPPSPYAGLDCECIKCCFHKRLGNQEYIIEDDDNCYTCICALPDEKANYKFMIPFVAALSLSVCQFGSMFSDSTRVMHDIEGSQSGWKRQLQVAADVPFALKVK